MFQRGLLGIYRILISLRLAVVLLAALTLALIFATTLESREDTATAQYQVYRAAWFAWLLGALGLNILMVALSRWPWKRRHLPFLLAHLGILLLLIGSWVTRRSGIDGMLRVREGEQESIVEVDDPQLIIQDGEKRSVHPLPWRPASAGFRPMTLPHGLVIEEYLSHADPVFSFDPAEGIGASSAVQLKFTTKRAMGGMPAMAASQEIWLWEGAPDWQQNQLGPARVSLGGAQPTGPGPWIWLRHDGRGGMTFEALSLRQQKSAGKLPATAFQKGSAILDPGWNAVQIEVLKFMPSARPRTEYVPAKIEKGPKAPPSALRLRAPRKDNGQPGETLWMGMGDRAGFEVTEGSQSRTIQISYGPKRYLLPFAIRLERFTLEHYPGSQQPASFSSQVAVDRAGDSPLEQVISMNVPLEWKGYTFYQSSYEEADPRPTVSIFSVNRDPGRSLKYWGSFFLVLGTIWFYIARSQRGRTSS